jgi:hypothetical protein
MIATSMEIVCSPPISGSIINSLESSFRIMVSNVFDDHLPMLWSPEGLGTSKIGLGVVFKMWDRKNYIRIL